MVVGAILGVGGLQSSAAAHHGPGGDQPGPPPQAQPSPAGQHGDTHGQQGFPGASGQAPGHAGAHGQQGQPGASGFAPGHAGAHGQQGQPGASGVAPGHAGAHGPHAGAAAATGTASSGSPGHPRVEVPVSVSPVQVSPVTVSPVTVTPVQPTPSEPTATTPSLANDTPRLGHALHGLTQPLTGTEPLVLPAVGGAFGSIRPTDQLTGGKQRSLSPATLDALVPAFPAPRASGGHGRSASRQAAAVGVRIPDPSSPNVIQRIERVVPLGVWIALAAALALAASAGVSTVVTGRRARRQAAALATVSAQALTDPLTGALNRRGFLDALERELARARRYQRPVAVAYVDVRGLKAVNDSEGHLAGDELLRQAAGVLQSSARADDVVGRIGGDELALLLGEQSSEGAQAVAARVQTQVAERRAALQLREPWGLTIGTASYPDDGATADELLAAADRRLYEQRGIQLR